MLWGMRVEKRDGDWEGFFDCDGFTGRVVGVGGFRRGGRRGDYPDADFDISCSFSSSSYRWLLMGWRKKPVSC